MTQEPPLPPTRTPARPHHAPGPTPAATPTSIEETDTIPEGVFHLVLIDDDHHTYAYVVEMMGDIFGYGREKAFTLATLVDHDGRVIVETADHERVSRHQRQIHGYGPDPRLAHSTGSMSAVIEDASGGP